MDSATMDREKTRADEDDGLGSNDDGTGIPGGAQPGDDGYEPPTPPADLPEDGPDTEGDAPAGLIVDGDHQLSLTIGGEEPTSSALKLKGANLELAGEFRKGDRLRVSLDLRIGAVKIEDTIDSGSGEVKSTKRTQWATVEGVQRLDVAE